ncbi:MAG: hypothetical protein K2P50_04765, partial [Lachnospiraceae bacterium]|nr:hypothetical protein [Lachnospiraceae bacterium]
MKGNIRKLSAVCLAASMIFVLAACGGKGTGSKLMIHEEVEEKVVNLFGPMEKSNPGAENLSRTAFDITIGMAEEQLGLTVEYRTYTAENYQEKTYDDVALDRVRNSMDDFYLLNPDTIQVLGLEGKLADLSGLNCVDNLREVVKTANVINGKLMAV